MNAGPTPGSHEFDEETLWKFADCVSLSIGAILGFSTAFFQDECLENPVPVKKRSIVALRESPFPMYLWSIHDFTLDQRTLLPRKFQTTRKVNNRQSSGIGRVHCYAFPWNQTNWTGVRIKCTGGAIPYRQTHEACEKNLLAENQIL